LQIVYAIERGHRERSKKMAEWGLFSGMEGLRREIDRAFEQIGMAGEPKGKVVFLPGRAARGYPLINLSEDKENLYVEALAPGVEPDSWNLTVVRNALTIAGEKGGVSVKLNPESYHRSERAAGRFLRAVDLPVEVDEERMQAEYRNGILFVTLPKTEKARPKQINVQIL
jgi:HSP20 family protein